MRPEDKKKLSILVTGISGFLGNKAANILSGYFKVKGLAREKATINGIEVFSSLNLEEISFSPDVVVMCHAAVSSGRDVQTNERLFQSNVALTENLCKRFPEAFHIYISSVSVYPIQAEPITETTPVSPASSYAVSKLWGERVTAGSKDYAIIRFPSLYGIGMKENTLIPNYVNAALQQNAITVWGDGSRLQNYIHVEDGVAYIGQIILNRQHISKKILLGTYQGEYSNAQVAGIISAISGCLVKFENEDNAPSFIYNNEETVKALSFKPKITLEKGIEEYIVWKKEKF
ncbi:MAG: NAD(P)-dependent oxidoreductase [Chitinophagaceae bacterium]|nr:NAD(P)-dependent oxidoreductase [Chitinophagaceae bacterium]